MSQVILLVKFQLQILLNDSVKCQRTKKIELDYLAKLIIRGG